MKRFSLIPMIVAMLLATKTLAGNLTVNGNLTVTTNLTVVQSITLGGVTQSNWPSALAGGYKYVIVAEGTNDLQRGNNLQAAYTTATTLDPTSSNRVVVLVPPGSYNLGATGLTMSTSYVDIIGLVPASMTTKQIFTDISGRQRFETVANAQCPVLIYASASAGTLVQNVDYVRIESVILNNTGSGVAYGPSVSGANTVLRHVSMSSMPDIEYAGQYVDCLGGFGGPASGTFIDCVGGDYSFASGGLENASGTFIDCTGGDYSYSGASGGDASGTFIDCVGGVFSFGSTDGYGDGAASGTFRSCAAGDESFAGTAEASGTFIDCVAGVYSFGGADPYIDGPAGLDDGAKLLHCQGGTGSFNIGDGASDDFNYNVGGANTFLMLPQLPTPASTNGLPSGTVYNSGGTLKVMP